MITNFKLFEENNLRVGDIVLVDADLGSRQLNEPCEIIDIILGSGSLGVKPLISNLGVKLIIDYDVIKKFNKDELDFYLQTKKYNL